MDFLLRKKEKNPSITLSTMDKRNTCYKSSNQRLNVNWMVN